MTTCRGVVLAAVALAACGAPTRPSLGDRHETTGEGDTTIVAESAGLTETLYLNKHVLVPGDSLFARAVFANHSAKPVGASYTGCRLDGVSTMLQWTYACSIVTSFITLAPGDSVTSGEMWTVTSPPGFYSFSVGQDGVTASIVLEVDRP